MSELRNVLSAWIAQANSPIGTIPDSTDPAEWVADRFLDWWEPHTRDAILEAEGALADFRQAVFRETSNGVAVETLEAFESMNNAIESIRAAFQEATAPE
jgi:hypothetical protein